MAADEKDVKSDVERESRERFVDRDDDSGALFVDRDDADGFLSAMDEDDEQDPGYAAFADELDNPLADWPSPESAMDDLPETRDRLAPDQGTRDDSGEGIVEDTVEDILYDRDSGETADSDDMLFASDDNDADPLTPDAVDSDRNTRVSPSDPGVTQAFGPGTDADLAPPYIPEPPSETPMKNRESESANRVEQYFKELQLEDDASEESEESYTDEFVDDFLNDLDSTVDADEPLDHDRFSGQKGARFAEPTPRAAALEASRAGRMTLSNTGARADMDFDSDPAPPRSKGESQKPPKKPGGSLPVGMIVVVLIALVLLAIGGYGVVQQRAEMDAEIRDLQARLATTVSPEEAAAERQIQRQIEVENESLSAEIEALAAENNALDAQLTQLQAEIAEREAAAEASARAAADEQAAAQRRAERAAAEQSRATAPAKAAPSTAVAGPWFVNFGSYAEQSFADRWAAKLSVEAGEVVVQSASAAGKTLYRVRVVGLVNQDSAERVATALERQYQLPRLWVGKN